MPSLEFVLPHWLYWAGLILFPLIAMYVTRRRLAAGEDARVQVSIAYLLWLLGGFVGLHRFYLRSRWGLVFIPLFAMVLFGNAEIREARDALSGARNQVMITEFELERAERAAEEDPAQAGKVEPARADVAQAQQGLAAARAEDTGWQRFTRSFALALAVLLIIDAVLLPRLVQRRATHASAETAGAGAADWTEAQARVDPVAGHAIHTRFTDLVDRANGFVGSFVAWWSLIAVFVYYYEVLARYVFNSPTNWAHESMFLMFGMQYLLAGAYALRDEAHVRVDVIYMHFSERGKAITDVITSVFFFIFTGALLWTGWTFAFDSISVAEVSFTEWAIQYWPVKLAIPVGAALLMLQGLARLIRDIMFLAGRST
ncbi:MAG: TRAP transporter small permease subunit [Pseudomonadota bacterium]|nr:MAG: TRAP transporter small permease subunit [Pseudomonadota bacterium]